MTKKEMYEAIKVAVADNAEMVAFCDHEIELLSKKRSKSTKPTKTQEANEVLKAEILEVLAKAEEPGLTVGSIRKLLAVPESGEPYTSQKITPQMYALEKEGKAVHEKVKKETYWTIVQ